MTNMKRVLVFLAMLGIGAVAQAQTFPTVTQLQRATLASSYQEACIPAGFNADDSVYGICYYKTYGICAGRGCAAPVHVFNYNTEWDLNGNPTSAVLCNEVTIQRPYPAKVVYFNGFTSCTNAVENPVHEVTYVFYGSYVWQYSVYYFVATSADGLYTLVDNGIVYPATPGIPQS